ncbi:MAG TPA: hypothetical protein VE870_01785, partial [Bacteroidales bacterium]|nr:hypothetical protein [Bacteroidales bacterium]
MDTRPAPSTAIFCLVTGSMMLLMWSFLISTGKVTGIDEHIVSFIFHWIAEFSTALLLILSGILIYRHHPLMPSILPLSLGLLLNAVHGMFWHYALLTEFTMAIPGAALTGVTLIYIFLNLKSMRAWLMLVLGLIDYGSINIVGNALNDGDLNT